jgi:hypothetical protein
MFISLRAVRFLIAVSQLQPLRDPGQEETSFMTVLQSFLSTARPILGQRALQDARKRGETGGA